MRTVITSNGSRWMGQEPDSMETLLEVLASEPLDPSFEDYGNFCYANEGEFSWTTYENGKAVMRKSEPMPAGNVRFFGNFYTVSHVFNIDTDEPEVIAKLKAAIDANKASEAYRKARMERMERPKSALERAKKGVFRP